MSGHDRITACLINEGKGLLASRPSVFVPLAAELLAGHEQERAEDDREWHSRAHQIPDDQLSEVVEFFEPLLGTTERREAVRQVAERAAQQALAFATGGSADSVRFAADSTDAYWDLRDSEYYELLMHLRVMFEKSLSTSDSSFEQIYWPSVGASGSARLHTCILDLVTRTEPSPKPAVLDELLQDGRLYTLSYAHPYLQRGIRQRWPSLSPPVKHAILDNIRGSGLAPAGNLFFPGPLLFAIPQAERPPETKVFIELMEVAAHPLDLPEPRAAPFAIAVPHRMQPAPPVPIAGLSAARALPWQSIAELSEQDITACTADRWVVLVELVQRLIDECLPNPEHLIGHADLVERVANLVDALRRRASLGAGVGSDSLLSLANWSLSALSTFPDAEVTADCEPFSGTLVGLPPKAALWMAMARLTDRLLWHPSLAGQTALDGGLFAAIAVHAKAAPERFAYYLLTRISGWLRSDGAGRDALHVVLLESIRNGHVASEGLRWVERFTRPEQQVLLKNWLTTDHAQPMQHAHEFVRKAGQHIGWAGLVRYEGTNEPTGSHDIFEELVARPSLHGVLADPSLHAFFVGQAVYGAKLALVGGAVPLERATEFFLRIDSCWSSLLPTMSEDPTRDRPAVALWALSPILETNENSEHSLRTNDRLAWWRAASATALAIVRDGPWQEIDHLMGALGKSSLLDSLTVTALRPVLEALDARTKGILQAAPRYRWDHALTSAAVVIECVAPFTTDNAARDWLFSLLTAWAAAPLSNEKAAQVARGLRTAS
jgi:hypothetical protein